MLTVNKDRLWRYDINETNGGVFICITRTCLARNLIVPLTPDAAMPLAQFADPWQKVQIKPDSEVTIYSHYLQI